MTMLDRLESMIDPAIMKTATVADLRNHFARIYAWMRNGEEVEIIYRGRRIGRVVPEVAQAGSGAKADFGARMKSIWGNRVFSDAEISAMRDSEDEETP
jgi:antitoxin (DNA-binding transcriptional repressor) of toxin-antitoxin stability system